MPAVAKAFGAGATAFRAVATYFWCACLSIPRIFHVPDVDDLEEPTDFFVRHALRITLPGELQTSTNGTDESKIDLARDLLEPHVGACATVSRPPLESNIAVSVQCQISFDIITKQRLCFVFRRVR